MKTGLILKFKQHLFSKVIWSSTFKVVRGAIAKMLVPEAEKYELSSGTKTSIIIEKSVG